MRLSFKIDGHDEIDVKAGDSLSFAVASTSGLTSN